MLKDLWICDVGALSVEEAVKKHKESLKKEEEGTLTEDDEFFNLLDHEVYGEGLAYEICIHYESDEGKPAVYSVHSSDIPGFDDKFKYEDELFDDALYCKWNLLTVSVLKATNEWDVFYELPESMFDYLIKCNVTDYKRPCKVTLNCENETYELSLREVEDLIEERG